MNAVAIMPEVAPLKERLKSTWMAGDYDRFSRHMERDARESDWLPSPSTSKMESLTSTAVRAAQRGGVTFSIETP